GRGRQGRLPQGLSIAKGRGHRQETVLPVHQGQEETFRGQGGHFPFGNGLRGQVPTVEGCADREIVRPGQREDLPRGNERPRGGSTSERKEIHHKNVERGGRLCPFGGRKLDHGRQDQCPGGRSVAQLQDQTERYPRKPEKGQVHHLRRGRTSGRNHEVGQGIHRQEA